ncbi:MULTISPECIES: DNA ligase D [unclassified Roseitalea]|uniref:DNA ligase D n=1 Tax=unclassified Roseitalea TaxID=2639107 RepID=UPI00273F1AEE|nr:MULTISPECIES: DNA ligase D [unclassified Roseitalea]
MAAKSDRLSDYAQKRDFSVTSEPSGKAIPQKRGKPVFVVQKHDATRLHYDFRLEWDGVLLSWAVTKGPSDDPTAKRLAVRAEDHPLDYQDFEGTIPKDEYGGGTVMVWDKGWWGPHGDVEEGLQKGKLGFDLHGKRMTGAWALVRMRRRKGEKRDNWLLIKERDGQATDDENHLTDAYNTSVVSGRTMTAIAQDEPPTSDPGSAPRQPPDPAETFTRKTPKFTPPELAVLDDHAPEGEDWLHEPKYDGYRCLAALGRDGIRLHTRSGKDWTERFVGLADALAFLDCESALIDGEVVAGGGGDPATAKFSDLQDDLKAGRPVRFMVFDLLELDGRSLRKTGLAERKERLRALIAGAPAGGPVRYSEHIVGKGPKVFKAIAEGGAEGIISKRADSAYTGRRSGKWRKVKAERRREFVIAGTTPSSARGRPFASVLLGTHDDGALVYRGRVGTGFDADTLGRLEARFSRIERKTSPFADDVPRQIARNARWLTPNLVAEIGFAELTADGRIRHGRFEGLREDKEAKAVSMQNDTRAEPGGSADDADDDTAAGTDHDDGGTVHVRDIRISSADRTVFPDAGCTKGDVARHYGTVGDRMLALAGSRPVSLLRCPRGTEGDCFFQKHAGKGFPGEIASVPIEEKSGGTEDYLVIDRPEGFVAAAQMGAIEFHIWGARTDNLEKPDRAVFDMDPGQGVDFAAVRAASARVRELLSDLGLQSVAMVTGGKGVHVIVPLRRTARWQSVVLFARTVATYFAQTEPDRFVATMSKAKRKGKVFVDWLRNERGSTAIAPYSLRARKGAPVAMPVTWQELERLDAANTFSMAKARDRLSRPCPLERAEADLDQAITKPVIERLEAKLE